MSEKPESCQCCFYDTAELEEYRHLDNKGMEIRRWFCLLCVDSLASRAIESPLAFADGAGFLAGVIMNAANHIIAEIRKQKPESEAK